MGRASRKKPPERVRGHFTIRPHELYVRISQSMLESAAWRSLTPMARCVLMDMLYQYNMVTSWEQDQTGIQEVPFTYTWGHCKVTVGDKAFMGACRQILVAGFFTSDIERKPGHAWRWYASSNWRIYTPPEADKRRQRQEKAVKAKRERIARGRDRRIAYIANRATERLKPTIKRTVVKNAQYRQKDGSQNSDTEVQYRQKDGSTIGKKDGDRSKYHPASDAGGSVELGTPRGKTRQSAQNRAEQAKAEELVATRQIVSNVDAVVRQRRLEAARERVQRRIEADQSQPSPLPLWWPEGVLSMEFSVIQSQVAALAGGSPHAIQ